MSPEHTITKKKLVSTLDAVCSTPEDLASVCVWLKDVHSKTGKTVILMDGDLGAGKTELVKQYLLHNNFTDVMSPTFSIINRYEVKNHEPIIHIDLYRTESEQEVESSGFWDLFLDESAALIFVEWASRLNSAQMNQQWNVVRLNITRNQDSSRRIHAHT